MPEQMGSSVLDARAIHIYTDGSCYQNPGGDSGCAAIVHFPDCLGLPDEQAVDFGCDESSINRMELMACVEGLRWVCANGSWTGVTRVLIVTDSQYITQNVFRAQGWKRNGYREMDCNRGGMFFLRDRRCERIRSGAARERADGFAARRRIED